MTHDTPDTPDDPIDSVADFEVALNQLLLLADRNDIDPIGAWECRNGDGVPDWEVVVAELSKRDSER